ncbi:MAG: 7TM domain-containing protein, partial [Parcubacteria group bacterium]
LSGMAMRFILKPFRLLYLPRVAIMLSVVAILILVMLTLGGSVRRTGLAAVSIFPILIMITLVEKFVAAQIEKGNKAALILTLETLVISVIGYFIASWDVLIRLIAEMPWLILLAIPINVLIGKWTGLRVSEYIRFRKIIKTL